LIDINQGNRKGDPVTAAGFVGVCGVLLAGTLLCAGVAKLAVPAHSSRAIAELLPPARAHAVLVTRLLAAVETGAALALSVPALRDAGASAAAALGAVFAASGAVAAVRGFRSPCGCFGRAGQKPMGVRNVAYGLALVAASAVLLFDGTGGWAAHAGLPMAGTAAVALLLAGWVYRDMIKDLGPTMRSTG
jgi:hypothetical protein